MAKSDSFTPTNKNVVLYSDFLVNLNPHPVVKDVVKYTNEHAITSAIRNLILTNKGERLYQPNLGSDIQKLLFENIGDATNELLSTMIQETIALYEPRAKVTNVTVTSLEEKNAVVASITYYIVNKQDPITVDVTLSRVR